MDVLLLDAERRWAVPVVRSLGRHGVRVLCASTERLAAASASRFSAGRVRCPPADHPDFAGWLDRTIDARGTGMVLGLAEPTLFRLLDLRDRIGGRAVLPYPDRAAFEAVADKAVSTELAREAGLAVPFTVAPRTVDEGLRLLRGFRYPCVVKPRTSSGARGFTVLHGPDEAHRYAAVHAEHGPALIQEMILDGTAVGVSFLYDGEGRRRATFAHRRLREFPATGGNCTLAESISPPEVA
ncbi:MAG: ATP-grasp domain-containing protein, partial [Actinobacteria bacterium]|nr:ATP-grasp domain-containing protein [Actinomycetota bacterium]